MEGSRPCSITGEAVYISSLHCNSLRFDRSNYFPQIPLSSKSSYKGPSWKNFLVLFVPVPSNSSSQTPTQTILYVYLAKGIRPPAPPGHPGPQHHHRAVHRDEHERPGVCAGLRL